MAGLPLLTSPLDQADYLLAEEDAETRASFYEEAELSLELLHLLKSVVDRHKDADSSVALLAGERALEASAHIRDPEAAPLGHWAYAMGLTVQGHFKDALEHFARGRQGYRAIGREVDAARVSMREVQALAMTGDFEGARELCQAIRETFAAAGMEREAAQASNNLGAIHARLGQANEALQALTQALAGFERLGDEHEVAKVHINLGYAAQQSDRYAQAQTHFETALAIFQRLDLRQAAANAMVVLALLHRRAGTFTRALTLLSQSRAIYGELETRTDEAVAQLEESRIHLELNLLAEAEEYASAAIRIFEEHDMEVERVEALTVLGVARAKRAQHSAALEALHEARRVWEKLNNGAQVALLDLEIAGVLFDAHRQGEAGNDLPRALEIAHLARDTLRELNNESGQLAAALLISELSLEFGDYEGAAGHLRDAQDKASSLGLPTFLVQVHHLSGRLAYRTGRLEAAERHFLCAVGHLESIRSALSVNEFRSSYLGDQLDVYGDLVRLLVDGGRLGEAFEFVERGKSRALLDLLSLRSGEGPEVDSPQASTLRERLAKVRAELDRLALEAERDGRSEDLDARMRQAEGQITTINRDLERLAPAAALEREVAVPEIEELLAPFQGSTVLVEYFAVGQQLSAFVVEEGRIRLVSDLATLPAVRHELERLTFFLSRVAQGGVYAKIYGPGGLQRNVDTHLAALYEQLLGPLALELQGKTLIVVPHGPVGAVPFSGLKTPDGYLIDQAEVAFAPSAAVYGHCAAKPAAERGPLAAFGVPVEDIPTVQAEIDMLGELVEDARVVVGQDATIDAFLAGAPQAGLLHIATHGVYRPDNPMFSGLRLADGWVNARDLHTLRLQAELVVLSACETGLSSFEEASEQFGLSRSFLFAGAPALVGSLWPVMDEHTFHLMRMLYERLLAGYSVAAALRRAQLALREDQPNPYYWAAFTVIGDPARRPYGA